MTESKGVVAILGGTGKEGQGLAIRYAASGRKVVIGSRDAEKARRVVSELAASTGAEGLTGASNEEAADLGDVVLSTLPYAGQIETVKPLEASLRGKMLITAAIRWPPGLDGKPSAAEELAEALSKEVQVVAAFQTVSAGALRSLEGTDDEDVLVFADDPETRRRAAALVSATGLRGVAAGPLAKTRVAEALTGLLLGVNKIHGIKSSGIRVTGLPGRE